MRRQSVLKLLRALVVESPTPHIYGLDPSWSRGFNGVVIAVANHEIVFNDRSKIYSKAKYHIKCDKLSKLELTERIIKFDDKG